MAWPVPPAAHQGSNTSAAWRRGRRTVFQGRPGQEINSSTPWKAVVRQTADVSQVEIEIASNRGEAELAHGRKRAEQSIVDAEAERTRRLLIAEADSKTRTMLGEAEGKRVALEGEAEARVLDQKIAAFGNPQLYAAAQLARHLSQSRQPLVPQHLFVSGNGNGKDHGGHAAEQGVLGTLIELLVAERTGFPAGGNGRRLKHAGTVAARNDEHAADQREA